MGHERGVLADAARREAEDARDRLSFAADRVRHEAFSAGGAMSALVRDALDRRGSDLGGGLQHIADTMRGMAVTGDGEPPRVVRQAVDVIDGLSQRLLHRPARDMHGKVARFGQDNPATFMVACLMAGMVTGRLLIAQSRDTGPVAGRDGLSGAASRGEDDQSGGSVRGPGHG